MLPSQIKDENIVCERYPLDYQTQFQKIQEKTLCRNTPEQCCITFCVERRLVRSHESLAGLWLRGSTFNLQQISLGLLCIGATACQDDSLQHQPFKSHIFLFLPNSDKLSSSSCLGQPFQAGIKRWADPLPWEFGATTLPQRPREG